jgi:hypothetical protein
MKKTYPILFFLYFLLSKFSLAQWSQNPGAPTRVCSVNSNQSNPTTIPDGQGGVYVFWEDNRSQTPQGGNKLLFAQRFAADGTKLFPDTGKLIRTKFSGMKETRAYGISRDRQGNFWISYAAINLANDSLVVCKFDKNTLNPIWTRPKAFQKAGPNFAPIIVLETRHIPDVDTLIVTWYTTWTGGSNILGWNRLKPNGEPMLPPNTYFVAGGGPYEMLSNPYGGFYIVQRDGNGAGTGVTARRINKKGAVVWGPQSLTTGTGGLMYDFKVQEDGTGGIIMVYVGMTDLMATRWDSAGAAVWTPAHKPVCNFNSNQDLPKLVFNNGFWYVVFVDNRLQTHSTYMQKLDLNGNRMWNPNGRLVFAEGSYLPHPRILNVENGNMIVTTRTTSSGFIGQKVRPDSTLAWPGIGRAIANSSAELPFYEQYTLTSGPGGVAFPVWVGFFSRALFIGSLDSSGAVPTSNLEIVSNENQTFAFPNPGKDQITIQNLKVNGETIQLLGMDGKTFRLPFERKYNGFCLRINHLPSGIYLLQEGKTRIKLVKKE